MNLKPEIIQQVLHGKSDDELRRPVWIGREEVPHELVEAEKLRRAGLRNYSKLLFDRGIK